MNTETGDAALSKIRREARREAAKPKPRRPDLTVSERRLFKKLQQAPGVAFGKRDKGKEARSRRLESKGYVTNRSGHWYPNFYGKVE